jgi:hypothetical protein
MGESDILLCRFADIDAMGSNGEILLMFAQAAYLTFLSGYMSRRLEHCC